MLGDGDGARQSTPTSVIDSAAVQRAAVLAATLLVGAWHWQNDGLWFQGDAPRHAATGLFFWDVLTTLPADPLGYALSYYARYPVLVLGAYPPLFHVLEGLGFGLFGASPYVARALVLACAALTGFYALSWGRRWIAPLAGWAGPCTVLLPGFMRYSNAVLLNVPAAALGLAALYHFQAWLDEGKARDRALFIGSTAAAVLTYYPGAIVLPVAIAWVLVSKNRARGRLLLLLSGLVGVVMIAIALTLPEYLARQMPSLERLTRTINWVFYSRQLTVMVGVPWVVLAGGGVLAGLLSRARRPVTVRLVVGLAAAFVCLALLPALDQRYTLLLAPLMVLTAFVGIVTAVGAAGRYARVAAAAVLVALLTATTHAAIATPVTRVSGIDDVARFLRANGSSDAVLYSGIYDGVFAFYVRAMDPGFERRVVLSGRFLYEYRQVVDFTWVETPHVTIPGDVVTLIRTMSGCRWVAVEVGGEALLSGTEQVLRRALEGPEFERVQSFPVTGRPVTRIDLYRFLPPLEPAPPMDLVFPSFSSRVFHDVKPVTAGQ